jgi:hypothetical protein
MCSLQQLETVEPYEDNRCGEVKARVENKELRDGHERITGVIAAAAAAAAAAAVCTTVVFIVTFCQLSTAWARSSRC